MSQLTDEISSLEEDIRERLIAFLSTHKWLNIRGIEVVNEDSNHISVCIDVGVSR